MRVVLNYGKHQDKHFEGLFMENDRLVIEKFNFTFPPISNLVELKSHEWCTSKCEHYHKAVISGGLPGDFIVYRHRAFRKTLVGFAHPGGTNICSGSWTK